MSKLIRAAVLLVVLTQISGCISATYVSSIGMRDRYSKIAGEDEAKRTIDIYEAKMEPAGGSCASFMPYFSLIPSKKYHLVEQREYSDSAIPSDKKYRKWYGYPAQTLQVIAFPVDIALDSALFIGGLVALPFFAIKEAVSPNKADKSNKSFKADAVPARP